ncbi:MAG: hypothetical protein BAJALOKI1v1_2480004 [Promethearchaeota archaeon]|nr:MAG: hypothetical protein BAJALOKI1v1_2480004 [Candidatus Lokiarchaeota archaeon]
MLKPRGNAQNKSPSKLSLKVFSKFIEVVTDCLESDCEAWFPWVTQLVIKILHSETLQGESLINLLRIYTSLLSLKEEISPIPKGRDILALSSEDRNKIKSILKEVLLSSQTNNRDFTQKEGSH